MTFPGQTVANVWGYTSEGREYALIGASKGLVIADVTNPDSPQQIVQIPGPTSLWKEIKTYRQYAYIVSEGGGGVQIVDLTNLPSSNLPYHNYTGDGPIQGQLGRIHALHIDISAGYLYAYGGNLLNGGAKILDLNADPYNPTYAGAFNQLGYIHDGYVDNDTMYSAHIYAGQFAIVDMRDKSNPKILATQNTPNNFTHNTWLSDDRKTLLTTDETSNSVLAAYDVSDPENITLLDKIQSNPGSNSIVHNTHILGNYAVTAWYKDGFTIVDITRPDNLVQVGHYDIYPNGSGSGFDGCWGVYPYFPSGNIIASCIEALGTNNGELWILTPEYKRAAYLEGRVVDGRTGNPINSVLVTIVGKGQLTTTADGVYKTGLPEEGHQVVQISKPGFQTQEYTVYFQRAGVRVLNVALFPVDALSVDGLVTDAGTGAPVPNAQVGFSSWSGYWEATTDISGQYSMANLPPGVYDVSAGAPGFGQTVKFKQKITASKTIDFSLSTKVKFFQGGDESRLPNLTASPNPFREETQIRLPDLEAHYHISVSDLTGRIVQSWQNVAPGDSISLGHNWPAGPYMLVVYTSDGSLFEVQRLIKATQ